MGILDSTDGALHFTQLVDDQRCAITVRSIGLNLAALLKLRYPHSADSLYRPDDQPYIVDFNMLLMGEHIQNVQIVVDRMATIFLVALKLLKVEIPQLTDLFLHNFEKEIPKDERIYEKDLNYWLLRIKGAKHSVVWREMY